MVKIEDLDREKIAHPSAHFSLTAWTEAEVGIFVDHLMNDYLYVTDEMRDRDSLRQQVIACVSGKRLHLLYKIGRMDGVFGFTDLIIDRRCDVALKLWNPKVWGPDIVDEGKRLIDYIMTTFGLVRAATITADPRIIRMAKMVGFVEEGLKKKSFTWNNKLYDETLLSIVR